MKWLAMTVVGTLLLPPSSLHWRSEEELSAALPLSCTFNMPANCGCGAVQGTLEAVALSANIAEVTLKGAPGHWSTSNVLRNSQISAQLTSPCADSTKTLRASPRAPKTWDTATCEDIDYVCS